LPVKIVPDHKAYKQRKVRILNGAHTSMAPAAYLAGQDIVRNCMKDPVILGFMNHTIYDEIIPTLNLDKQELLDFAAAVSERFANPFIDHALLAISLNSTSKWRVRILPSLKAYVTDKGCLPQNIVFGLAAYIAFYRGTQLNEKGLQAKRGEESYLIQDDWDVLAFYAEHKADDAKTMASHVLSNTKFWGEDLTSIDGLLVAVTENLQAMESLGMYEAMKQKTMN
jgi:tagaturonate reductase